MNLSERALHGAGVAMSRRSAVVNVLGTQQQVTDWDNSLSYEPGDDVLYQGKWWRVVKHVSPPSIPLFQKGDVPGTSDSWVASPSTWGRVGDDGDGDDMLVAVNELLGFDMSFLSALASGANAATGADAAKAAEAQRLQLERERAQREKDAKAAHSSHVLWTILGIVGAGILVGTGFFVMRHK